MTTTDDVRLLGGAATTTVISSVVDELNDAGIMVPRGGKQEVIRHTGAPSGDSGAKFKLIIAEATVDSFAGGNINLEFTGIPDGVSVTLDAWVATLDEATEVDEKMPDVTPDLTGENTDESTYDQVSINSPGTMNARVDADDDTAQVLIGENAFMFPTPAEEDAATEMVAVLGGTLDPSERDAVIVQGYITTEIDEEDLPIDMVIQVSAEVGPIGRAKPTATGAGSEKGVPRFASDKTTPVTVIESTSDQTELKIPFATYAGPGGFDTGIAVSNMSSGSNAQPGAIHFAFYMGGNKTEYSTSAGSPGSGLNSSGMLEPGGTYAVLLSQLLAAAGETGAFNGYVIIMTDFTAADGNVFISDFQTFSSTGTVRPPAPE